MFNKMIAMGNGDSGGITDLPIIISTVRSYDNSSRWLNDFTVKTQGYGTLSSDGITFTFSKDCKCIVFVVAGDVYDSYNSGSKYEIYVNGSIVETYDSGSVAAKLLPKAIPMDFKSGDEFKVYWTARGQCAAWCCAIMEIQ